MAKFGSAHWAVEPLKNWDAGRAPRRRGLGRGHVPSPVMDPRIICENIGVQICVTWCIWWVKYAKMYDLMFNLDFEISTR